MKKIKDITKNLEVREFDLIRNFGIFHKMNDSFVLMSADKEQLEISLKAAQRAPELIDLIEKLIDITPDHHYIQEIKKILKDIRS